MKRLKFLNLTLAIIFLGLIGVTMEACKSDTAVTPVPSIASFAPTSGKAGDQVVITGTNFDATAANNTVNFNGAPATVSAATATTLTVSVPANATTGIITVIVKGQTATSSTSFTVGAAPVTTTIIQGELTPTSDPKLLNWTADQKYLLKGYVYVTAGTTLNIAAGTIIKGDKASKGALIIEPGAKINAVGTASKPIIFTSNQPKGSRNYGDWGGVILCGKANVNWMAQPKSDGTTGTVPSGQGQVEGGPRTLYGGTDDADNSGTLQYVRIEFGGVAFSLDNEINGLTLCGVGNKTTIDHIQVSYAGDDSIEWFGGSVNGKYLIAHRGLDDDFDTDNGFSGKVQFAVGLRDPNVADQSGSKGFESDSFQGSTNKTQATTSVFSNVTIIGGVVNPNSTAYDPQFVSAIHNRRGSRQSYYNDVFIAYPAGLLINNEYSGGTPTTNSYAGQANPVAITDAFDFKSSIFGGIPTNATGTYWGISPTNGAATASFDKNIVVVTNDIRSRTPSYNTTTNPQIDSVTYASFFTGTNSASGPYKWFGSSRADVNNTNLDYMFYTAQTGVRLQNAFTLTNPSFFPTSSSPITTKTGSFPTITVNFTGKAADAFFDKVDYIGAFKFGGTDWTIGWTNWDPNNADYGDAY